MGVAIDAAESGKTPAWDVFVSRALLNTELSEQGAQSVIGASSDSPMVVITVDPRCASALSMRQFAAPTGTAEQLVFCRAAADEVNSGDPPSTRIQLVNRRSGVLYAMSRTRRWFASDRL